MKDLYIYLDENGVPSWPATPGEEYFLVTALLAYGRKSKEAISRSVGRTYADLRRHRRGSQEPPPRFTELKGSSYRKKGVGHLGRYPLVRYRLLRRMARKADFQAFTLMVDKRRFPQPQPGLEYRRYSRIVLNLLARIPIPRWCTRVFLTVDSKASAEATRGKTRKTRYPSRRKRLAANRKRWQDRRNARRFRALVLNLYKRILMRKGVALFVRQLRSEEDRCLQAVDVLSHRAYDWVRAGKTGGWITVTWPIRPRVWEYTEAQRLYRESKLYLAFRAAAERRRQRLEATSGLRASIPPAGGARWYRRKIL